MDTQTKGNGMGAGGGVWQESKYSWSSPYSQSSRGAGVNSAAHWDTTVTHLHMSLEACGLLGCLSLSRLFPYEMDKS